MNKLITDMELRDYQQMRQLLNKLEGDALDTIKIIHGINRTITNEIDRLEEARMSVHKLN